MGDATALELSAPQDAGPIDSELSVPRRLLGELLIEEGLITELQLQEALTLQRESTPHVQIGQILVDRKAITQRQLKFVLEKYHKKYKLGDILVETGVITEDQLQIGLLHHRATGLRLGQVFLQLKFITEEQLKRALSLQQNATFVDLDTVAIDRAITALVNPGYARERQVIPLVKTENRLVVAMDDPTDVDVVEELASMTDGEIRVVTSTRAAFLRALARAYDEPSGVLVPSHDERPPEADEGLLQEDKKMPSTASDLRESCKNHRTEGPRGTMWFRELEARHESSCQALADLQTMHEEIRGAAQTITKGLAKTEQRYAVLADWGAFVRDVEQLAHEHEALRDGFDRLEREHEALCEDHEQLKRNHEKDLQVLDELRSAHEALRADHGIAGQALQHIRDGYEALVRGRQRAADDLESLARRLRVDEYGSDGGRP